MDRNKILRSYTIIPHELYVERDADVQLKRIVEDMGRPGYILVARQMGKTNLLLNAKRSLGCGQNKFIYLDVSNPFPEIRQFFRNIIDVAIESYPEDFSSLHGVIRTRRKDADDIPPHKEHENELRELLRAISGYIAICLDEIDALTNTTYSDLVFSLIRSTYFSGRVNIPEFSRLTFVLSGVAEPSELIRNKDVSPFNIGEKIFLDDFSLEEFSQFVNKAQLPFQGDVITTIFSWCNGNPRISWDICAALEDVLIDGGQVTPTIVDDVVGKMYLTKFDRPPIDHIRTLVEADDAVRDAIMSLHYGKSAGISDGVLNKLYLAGITKPIQRDGTVSIRNPILQESLSESWIQDVEKGVLSLFDMADKKFKKGQYAEALPLFENFLSSHSNKSDMDLGHYRIGECLFKLGKYPDAIAHLKKTNFGKGSTAPIYYSIAHMLGVSHLLNGDSAGSIEHFRRVLEQTNNADEQLTHYFDACINLSTALFDNFEESWKEIISLSEIVTSSEMSVQESSNSDYPASAIISLANHNLASVCKRRGNYEDARLYLQKAISKADTTGRVALTIEMVVISNDRNEKRALLEECVDFIRDNKVGVDVPSNTQPFALTSDGCVQLIEMLEDNEANDALDKFFSYFSDKSVTHRANIDDDVVQKVVFGLITKGKHKSALKLVKKALGLSIIQRGGETHRTLMSLGVLLSHGADGDSLGEEYVDEYFESFNSSLVPMDFRIVWELVQRNINKGSLNTARGIFDQVHALLSKGSITAPDEEMEMQISSGRLIFDVLELDLLVAEKDWEGVKAKADVVLSHINEIDSIYLPYFDGRFLKGARDRVKKIASVYSRPITIKRAEEKIGRNQYVTVQFQDGTTAHGKFKKFQSQIYAGICKVVANNRTGD